MSKLWIVGKIESDEEFRKWGLIGVFDSEEKATDACRTKNHFLGPVVLNHDLGDMAEKEWPNARFPRREPAA